MWMSPRAGRWLHYLNGRLPAEGDILDLMSAYRSHLPEELSLNSVTGLGMNKEELSKNSTQQPCGAQP